MTRTVSVMVGNVSRNSRTPIIGYSRFTWLRLGAAGSGITVSEWCLRGPCDVAPQLGLGVVAPVDQNLSDPEQLDDPVAVHRDDDGEVVRHADADQDAGQAVPDGRRLDGRTEGGEAVRMSLLS